MRHTVTIQIGNSDDKLPQAQWSNFVSDIDRSVIEHCQDIHFHGFSPGNAEWQNACWVAQVMDQHLAEFKSDLMHWREKYDQDSLAFTIGETTFI